MTPERRNGGEFRVSGRTLSGTVLRYGDISPDYRERFLPGAFGQAPEAPLNIQHDASLVVLKASDYVLSDSATSLEIRAELPPSSAALKLVRRGALTGYSVEFNARRETRLGGVRVIERADLVGVGLVDQPAYPASKAEVRRAEHRATLGTLGWRDTGRCEALIASARPVRMRDGRFRDRCFRARRQNASVMFWR